MQLHRDANPFYTEDFYIKMAEFEIKIDEIEAQKRIEQESLIYRIFSSEELEENSEFQYYQPKTVEQYVAQIWPRIKQEIPEVKQEAEDNE